MDTQALKTVALVGKHGSFASAARVLNVDPSSVSRTVAAVEAAIGLRLFERTTRALNVTEAGAVYLARLAPLLEELDRAREEAAALRVTPSGTLKLTASVAFAHECIVPHLGDFHARYPEISVELLANDANLDLLADGVDLAVRLAPAPAGDLISTRLRATRYRVVAAPAYLARHKPLTDPGALAQHQCVRFALPDYRARWWFRARKSADVEGGNATNAGAPFDVEVGGWLVVANALALRSAVRDGLGPALLADWLVADDIARGRLVDLFPDHDCTATTFDTAAWALYPSRAYLPQKVRVMIDFLRERVGRAMPGGEIPGDVLPGGALPGTP